MLFNSIDFAIFLPIVFLMYWFVFHKNLKLQNILIVVISYFFYAWWDWRFLSLIIFSTLVDYTIGLKLENEKKQLKRKILLWVSILVNLGCLGFFKYYNFFLDNFITAFSYFGMHIKTNNLNIILPIGISFYTFQTLSYTIDVYHKKLKPTKDLIVFSAFVSFFPQLVAGPIERASNLLPQFTKKRIFNNENAIKGIRLILWGLIKKVVIADSLAPTVNDIFTNFSQYPSSILLLGTFFFSFQIYCDFSGYSMIARGVAKLFGFELMTNFKYPYFSRSIGEFWRKWHISLTTWFRDYLYIPIGGSRVSKLKTIINVCIVFLVSGFWHGANWTFIAWGGLHALLFIPAILTTKKNRIKDHISLNAFKLPSLSDSIRILCTFCLVSFCWIFFRADSIDTAILFIQKILLFNFESINYLNPYDNQPLGIEYLFLSVFILVEYLLATKTISLYSKNRTKGIFIDAVLFLIITFSAQICSNLSFIYFQF
ncbi:MBOAT family O-acyltransferase [uncultured Formosa sp.]|uniref:MBOAT family O-acyltransferase n=1 Tax=uncultured Formosa sp. TaxID=255435 RepID=UPI002611FF93|nr:MBOAT family O-acyltransferase [uncultured Formosa sp.]